VPLQCFQSAARLDVVRCDIDRVLEVSDAAKLADLAADVGLAPEARLLSAAKLEAMFELDRAAFPNISLKDVRLCVGGLDSTGWASATHYCSLFESTDGAVEREQPLP
jgi:hypothetical protein